jgi:hypothetical protein
MPFKMPLALFLMSLIMTAEASGQSGSRAQQQAACEDDAYRLCPDAIPDEARISSCLARHKASLSLACQAQFKPPQRRRHRKR